VSPLIIGSVAFLSFWAYQWRKNDDAVGGFWFGLLLGFAAGMVTWMPILISEENRERDACHAACTVIDAPFAGARDGQCWCYRSASEQFKVEPELLGVAGEGK
jgi:hypothetical protein